MRLANSERSWGWGARALHWIMAVLILFQLALGLRMTVFTEDLLARFELTQVHKSWGSVIFALALLRLGWRI
ncbi:MAG: cytochrome b/b6 domain-containing protein, partial [Rhodobacteraceae bacterium]|nr:cytochrome b/b6 domain-containing protein [Paracoccaceae bacterium]